MHLWRISNHADLNGLGGQLLDGRWHTASFGKRIVYLSEHPALALIENLANLRGDPKYYPSSYQMLRISTLSGDFRDSIGAPDLVNIDIYDLEQTQALGDRWLTDQASVFLRVPSAPAPESWNYLMNPLHPSASSLHIDWAHRIAYDHRLFHVNK